MTSTPINNNTPLSGSGPRHAADLNTNWLLTAGIAWIVLAAAGIAVFWAGFKDLLWIAWNDIESSHILLIPPLVAYLIWQRFDVIRKAGPSAGWLGLLPLATAVAVWEIGYREDHRVGSHLAIILWVVGTCIIAFGHRAAIKVGWPVLGLLLLAMPIPYSVRVQFAVPAQHLTAIVSEQVLLILGISVVRTGSVLNIGDTQVGIAEACNGMRMLFAVVLICYAYAVASPMRWWARVVLTLISPFIALVCDGFRVVPTTWVYGWAETETAEAFHDFSGWATAALAFGMVWCIGHFSEWLGLPVYRTASASSTQPSANQDTADHGHPANNGARARHGQPRMTEKCFSRRTWWLGVAGSLAFAGITLGI
ncbi:MAG: exosortase/archaeosortase family protein, partial [Rhodospirillales bacterium]|nr:exosortase/archaeosortase family protein [Rhodospirillales bacterium]